ncbi:succinylglutamate desuccinylase/aspartoacylase domain-containing protein [Halomicrobium salinisoli]|uniref:succinylglutamate desuccinylase/aspartoacylase domain-containing protein n=1 Tax=Halomicrobium salinisoli TaxID=2878391 RepID=UPI001CF077C2|nr:succinylglutamate desuccinylase/aspartoacylase family protein [Halomicrobium salinisoli]
MRIETLGDGEPEVAVVGGIHGDEPAGVHAVETLLEERPEVERPVALVVANEEAIAAGERYLEADLNRSFPGSPDAETHEERLAAELVDAVGDCTTLALHTTQSYGGLFALVDEVDDLARSVCPRLSVDAVVEVGPVAEGRVFASIPDTIEVECGYQGSEAAKDNAVQVAREFLRAVGALPGEAERKRDELPVFRLGGPVAKQSAEVYEVYATNFEEVAAGEAFAAADGDPVHAEEPFHPVLMSSEGYEDVFGYTAERVGTL